MAIERRVKPSDRAREELSRRRKPIAIVVGALVLVAVLVFAGVKLYQAFPKGNSNNVPSDPIVGGSSGSLSGLPTSTMADQAALASGASYEGNWFSDATERNNFYVPGTQPFDASELTSNYVATNEGVTQAFGVIMAEVPFASLNGDPTQDMSAVLSAFIQPLAHDVGAVMYGATFSGAYDMSALDLSDGSRVVWVTGDMQTVVSKQPENGQASEPAEMYFPFVGFIALRDDQPIMVWGVANPDDGVAVQTLDTYMRECARIFASSSSSDFQLPAVENQGTDATPAE